MTDEEFTEAAKGVLSAIIKLKTIDMITVLEVVKLSVFNGTIKD